MSPAEKIKSKLEELEKLEKAASELDFIDNPNKYLRTRDHLATGALPQLLAAMRVLVAAIEASRDPWKALLRHEIHNTLEAALSAAAKLLEEK